MKRISILCAVLVMFVLGTSTALAKGPKEGKGKPATAGVKAEKSKAEVVKEVEAGEEDVKAAKENAEKKTRKITTRDPKTGKTSTREVEISEKEIQEAKKRSRTMETRKPKPGEKTRTVTIRDPKTGRMVTKQVPVVDKKEAKAAKEKADDKAKGKGPSTSSGQGKGKDQKAVALAKQLGHEQTKHETCKARLAEMLKVAEEKGDDKAVGRIQKLIDREQSRFEKKNKKMTERGSKKDADDDEAEKAGEDDTDKKEDGKHTVYFCLGGCYGFANFVSVGCGGGGHNSWLHEEIRTGCSDRDGDHRGESGQRTG